MATLVFVDKWWARSAVLQLDKPAFEVPEKIPGQITPLLKTSEVGSRLLGVAIGIPGLSGSGINDDSVEIFLSKGSEWKDVLPKLIPRLKEILDLDEIEYELP